MVVFFFVFWFCCGSLVAAVNGRHASSSSASRRRSLADGDLTRRSGLLSLQSLFCTHSPWCRSRCIIKRPGGGYSVARAVTSKGQGVFHSAGHKDCCVVELATLLFLFLLVGFLSHVLFFCGRRRETHFFVFVRIAPQVAGRQTSLSHADRDFSLALALLHAVDVRVAGVATCKCQRGDFLSLSSAKRLLPA